MFDFPASPTVGQVVTGGNGASYQWDGVKWDASSTITGTTVNNVGRNLIHNSMFNINHRGTGAFTTSSAYTSDRWLMAFIGGTMSVSLIALSDANRTAIGDEAARTQCAITFTGGSGANDENYFEQRIESVARLASKTVTLSFYAAVNTGTLKLGATMYQIFGTGGSPSATVGTIGQSVTLTSTYTRYTMTWTLPSIAGKTIGTNGNDYTLVRFGLSAGSTLSPYYGNIGVQSGLIALWGIQLEIGNVATPLEKLDIRNDLANCQRFYQTGAFDLGGYHNASNTINTAYPLRVTMCALPTITVSGVVNSNTGAPVLSAWSNETLDVAIMITATGGGRSYGTWQASADL